MIRSDDESDFTGGKYGKLCGEININKSSQ